MTYGPTRKQISAVANYIMEHPGHTYTEICKGTDVTYCTGKTILDNFLDEGHVERVLLFSSRTPRFFPTRSLRKVASTGEYTHRKVYG